MGSHRSSKVSSFAATHTQWREAQSDCSVVIHCDGVFAVIEVAIGEYDTDITVLAAEAAKGATERRKLPTLTSEAKEEVMTATCGKWHRSTNSNMSVHFTAYVATQ